MNNQNLKIIEFLTILELPLDKQITVQEVKESYRKLSHIYHPDVANERYKDGKKFILLQEAKDFLCSNIEYVNRLIISNFNLSVRNNNNYWDEQERRRKAAEEMRKQHEEQMRKESEERRKREEELRKAEAERIKKLNEHISVLIIKAKELLENVQKNDYYDNEYNLIMSLVMFFVEKVKNVKSISEANDKYNTLENDVKSVKNIKTIEKNKKNKKIIYFSMSIIGCIIVILLLLNELVIPSIKYQKANAFEENGEFSEALRIYDDLDDFKDSSQKVYILKNKINAIYIEKLISKELYYNAIDYAKKNNFKVDDSYDLQGGEYEGVKVTLDTRPMKVGTEFVLWQYIDSKVDVDSLILEINFKAEYTFNVYSIEYIYDCNYNGELVENFTIDDEVILPVLSKFGYKFDGWIYKGKYIDKIPKGTNCNVKVQAHFTPITVNITFDEDGGTKVNDINVKYDSQISYPIPTKEGYIFVGWTKNGLLYEPEICDFIENIHLKASWKAADYIITLKYCNGTPDKILSRTYGERYNITEIPSKTGYTFAGWFLSSNYSGDMIIADSMISSTGNHSLYARWTPVIYTINYDLNGAVNNESNLFSYTIEDEVPLYEPTKPGYTFEGWALINENKIIDKIDINTTGDIFIKAIFSANEYEINIIREHYIVSFDLNGGESQQIPDQLVSSKIGIVFPEIPKRSGYCFKGWYTTKDCVNIYDFSSNIQNNLTLYAGWEKVGSDATSIVVDGRNLTMSLSNYFNAVSGKSKGTTIFFSALDDTNFKISLISNSIGDREVVIRNYTTNKILFEGEINKINNKDILINVNQGDILSIYSFSWSNTNITCRIIGLNTPLSTGVSVKKNTEYEVKYNEYFNIYTRSLNGYIFVGYFDENNVQVTDSEGNSLLKYLYVSDIILHEVWMKE